MRRWLFLALFFVFLAPLSASAGFLGIAGGVSSAVQPTNFFIAPSGVDGVGCGTLVSPCASPNGVASNNSLVCGNTITADTGTYSQANMTITSTVSCPSQNDVVMVTCATAFGCAGTTQILVEASYWGVSGWAITSGSLACILVKPPTNGQIGTIAIVDNIASGCSQGGIVFFQNGSGGVGNTVVIGNIVYNAALGTSACYTGITHGSMLNFVPSGDELYAAWNFSYGNNTAGISCNTTIYTISSGTYNSGTGAVSLTLTASSSIGVGTYFCVGNLTGTGAFASLNGCYTSTSGTSGTTVNYTAATSLGATTITGGQTAKTATDLAGLNFDTMGSYTGTSVAENNWLGWNGGPGFEFTTHSTINAGHVTGRYNTMVNNITQPDLVLSSATEFLGGAPAVGEVQATYTYNLAQGNAPMACNGGSCVIGYIFSPQDTNVSTFDNNWGFESNTSCNQTGCGASVFGSKTFLCQSPHPSPVGPNSFGSYFGANSLHGGICTGNTMTTTPALTSTTEPGAPSCGGQSDTLKCFATQIANLISTTVGSTIAGAQVAAPTDAYNSTPFLCHVYAEMPQTMFTTMGGLIPSRCANIFLTDPVNGQILTDSVNGQQLLPR